MGDLTVIHKLGGSGLYKYVQLGAHVGRGSEWKLEPYHLIVCDCLYIYMCVCVQMALCAYVCVYVMILKNVDKIVHLACGHRLFCGSKQMDIWAFKCHKV